MTVTSNPFLVVMAPRAHGSIQIGSILLCFPQLLHWDEVIAYFLTPGNLFMIYSPTAHLLQKPVIIDKVVFALDTSSDSL